MVALRQGRGCGSRRTPLPAAAKSLIIKNLPERESANFADSLSDIYLSHSNLAAAHSITIRHYHTTATNQQHTGKNTNTPTTPRDHTKPRAPNPLTHSHFLKTNRPISPICFQHLADTQSLSCPAQNHTPRPSFHFGHHYAPRPLLHTPAPRTRSPLRTPSHLALKGPGGIRSG